MSGACGRTRADGCEDRDARLEQRERTVLEVGGGIRVGEDPRQLLELERPLAGCRVFVPAREDEQAIGVGLVGGHRLDSGLEPDRPGDRVRDRGQRADVRRVPGHRGRQRGDRQQLGRVGLGGGDRELGARAEIDARLGGRGER